ncbi:MAG: T9SS type A sorting domain-containing protein [Ignavibacteria bacterium]
MKVLNKILVFFILVILTGEVNSQSLTWQKIMLYTNNSQFYKSCPTKDGGIIAVGSNRIGNYQKIYIAKFNSLGDSLWAKYFDLNINKHFDGFWIEETIDLGFIISCTSDAEACLLKVDSFGNFQWNKVILSGSGIEQAKCVKQLSDNGFIIIARTTSNNNTNDIKLIRTDQFGNNIWSKNIGDEIYDEIANEIQYIKNSGFIITGWKQLYPNAAKLFLIRTDINGDTLWTKTINEYYSSGGYSIDLTEDEGFIIGGLADTSSNNHPNAYVLKTDSIGNIQWSRRYSTGLNEICYAMRKHYNRGYVFCGMSDSTILGYERAIVRKIDLNGNILFEKYFRPGPENNAFRSIEVLYDGGFIMCGYSDISNLKSMIVKTDSLGFINPVNISVINQYTDNFELFQNFPNPFNSETLISFNIKFDGFIKLTIFNINGNNIAVVLNEFKKNGFYRLKFNANSFNLSTGVYFYKLEYQNLNSKIKSTKKFIYLK